MCGIFGALGLSLSRETLKNVHNKIQHRGPDDFHEISSFKKIKFTSAAVRLAFQDVENGKQPFVSKSQDGIIVSLNGEIYNYRQLREIYEKDGYIFETFCDTEILIPLYKKDGIKAISKINGMHALSIIDKSSEYAFLATDFLSQKPIFYYLCDKILLYASELNPLVELIKNIYGESCFPNINKDSLNQIILYKSTINGNTVYEGIKRLNPGEVLRYDFKNGLIDKYYNDDFQKIYKLSHIRTEKTIFQSIDELLRAAVKKRIDQNKPQAIYLSGGLDSSLISSIMRDLYPKIEINSFTLAYEGLQEEGKSRDLKLAKTIAEKNSLIHHIIKVNPEKLDNFLPEILNGFGEPFASVPSMWFIAKEIKKFSKYSLSGDGADELFGSYFTHREAINSKIKSINQAENLFNNYMSSFLTNEMNQSKQFNKILNFKIGGKELRKKIFKTMDKDNSIFNQLLFESRMLFPYGVLTYIDRLSMAHSIEPRSPFLDKDLWNFIFTLDDSFRIRNGETKYALKKVAEKYLPKEIIYRKKEGFVFPLYPYLIKSKSKIIERIIHSKNSFKEFGEGWLNKEWLENAFLEIETNKGLAFKTSQILHSLNLIAIWAENKL